MENTGSKANGRQASAASESSKAKAGKQAKASKNASDAKNCKNYQVFIAFRCAPDSFSSCSSTLQMSFSSRG